MASSNPADPTALLDPASPAMGERLVEAWRTGVLVLPLRDESSPVRLPGLHKSVLPPSLSGQARVSLAGVGEHFAAWRLVPQENAPLIVRIPHVPLAEMPQDLAHEIAALTLVPPDVGPQPIAFHDEPADEGSPPAGAGGPAPGGDPGDPAPSPIGHPFVVTSEMPGTAAVPEAWTAQNLAAHAAHLAHLHSVPAPGRGPVTLGRNPWAAIPRGTPSLLSEVEAEVESWRSRHGALIRELALEPFLDAALSRVATVESDIAQLDGFVLAHGDLCATNIMWDRPVEAAEPPAVGYIDFEWAQGDDPARDLAIIGGAVHGGPWYVPLDEDQVSAFVDAYVRARAEHGPVPASVADVGALRRRMRAWTAYERTAMLVHVASRAATRAAHRQVLPVLRGTLAEELGLDDAHR
ncbi:phosphotransferase [Brachybacterium sp. GCM10030267]|uniref:phosphotransferase n=1 Tax=Brachybacterium sp. GCM10030267 TaxID=3273381 RepID=UPI00361DF36D